MGKRVVEVLVGPGEVILAITDDDAHLAKRLSVAETQALICELAGAIPRCLEPAVEKVTAFPATLAPSGAARPLPPRCGGGKRG